MRTIARVGGMSAIAGGLLRILNIALAQLPPGILAAIYLATDALLLAGVAGLWATRRGSMGTAGAPGLAVFVAGILAIRASAFGFGSYPLGAGIALLGLAIYALDALWQRQSAIWAPVFWLSAGPPAVTAALGRDPFVMSALAAFLFGAGFIFVGIELLRVSRAGIMRT